MEYPEWSNIIYIKNIIMGNSNFDFKNGQRNNYFPFDKKY